MTIQNDEPAFEHPRSITGWREATTLPDWKSVLHQDVWPGLVEHPLTSVFVRHIRRVALYPHPVTDRLRTKKPLQRVEIREEAPRTTHMGLLSP